MIYAEVAVNIPAAQQRAFTYNVPPGLSVCIGHAVWVPFGPKVCQGVVLELTEYTLVEQTKEILGVIGVNPILTSRQVALAQWISNHYLAPLFESVALMLPPGFEQRLITFIESSGCAYPNNLSLTDDQQKLLELLDEKQRLPLGEIEKAIGKKKASQAIDQLVRKRLIKKTQELGKRKINTRVIPHLSLASQANKVVEEIELLNHRAPRQAEVLRMLMDTPSPVSVNELRAEIVCSAATIKALEDKGLIAVEHIPIFRNPLLDRRFPPFPPPILTKDQQLVLQSIKFALQQPKNSPTSFLLHGITGSGKTEVYLQALAEAVSLGKRAIVLVPEISLTPQTIARFASRFPNRVAVLHSKLSLREQFDEWHQIREGAFDVVIGSRGAIFAPLPDIGLIVIDEEHEWTYKQQEQSPRYHARQVALKMAELSQVVVVMGSATPDIKSFYSAKKGVYQLLSLPSRVTSYGEALLPTVDIVDMRNELKSGNRSLFSRPLNKAIERTLMANEQVILFLNRRGTSTFVQCRDCGFIIKCRRCDLPLTYHSTENFLMCHQCNYRKKIVDVCPNCSSRRIKFLGAGTQKIEEEAKELFPNARVLRWDRDVTKGRHSHEDILNKFVSHEADILIGTQMVAKGLDIPLVTLVGVVLADTIMHLPDFGASERTFQLLSQVAGRAGRGNLPGRVIIQTYAPEHYAVIAAATHDYAAFYDQEIGYRRQFDNPPFSQLVRLMYSHTNNESCQQQAEKMAKRIKEEIISEGLANIALIGPAPMMNPKIRGKFRWQIILRGSHPNNLLSKIPMPQGWTIDVDPTSLM